MSTRLIVFLISLTLATIHALNCTDECLLYKLGFTNPHNTDQYITLNSYNIFTNQYTDEALLWINPSAHFSTQYIQSLTHKQNPTNDDIRHLLSQQYLQPNNIQLILQINSNPHTKSDSITINTLITKYGFDGYVYNHTHRRTLLQDTLEFDIQNQHTYDEYDWFLAAFSLLVFSCLCLCFGWCGHKKYVSDKIVEDEDIEMFKTPIGSPSDHNENGHSFNGFNIFGDKQEEPSRNMSYNGHIPSQTDMNTFTPTLISVTPNTSTPEDFHLATNNLEVQTLRQLQLQALSNGSGQSPNAIPVIYETDNATVQVINPTVAEQQMVIAQKATKKSVNFMLPRISMPSTNIEIVPEYKSEFEKANIMSPQTAGIDCMASPDSCEPSQSHVSVNVLRRVDSNGSALGYSPTEDVEQSPVGFQRVQSSVQKKQALMIINEADEHASPKGTSV